MRSLLRADLYRLFRSKWLRLCALFMVGTAAAFVGIQRTAMENPVALNRVIFLPMAFYGIAVSALVSLFVGEDFADGAIKNKLLCGTSRTVVYRSSLLTGWAGCAAVYLMTLTVTLGLGIPLFEGNVTAGAVAGYGALGLFTCLAYGGIFCMIATLTGNRSVGSVLCMLLAFFLLFLCLHTNQVLVQEPFRDGAVNPDYVTGGKRILYELLHDLNPSGQAAQLSAMRCLNPVRFLAADLLWILITALAGPRVFRGQDIR